MEGNRGGEAGLPRAERMSQYENRDVLASAYLGGCLCVQVVDIAIDACFLHTIKV